MISLCDRLGIEAPILQAPIGNATSPAIVAAVSNAGGLGMLAGTWRPMEELRAAIREIRSRTSKPFAINLGVHMPPAEKIDLCLHERVPIISLFWGDARQFFNKIKTRGATVLATIGTPAEAEAAAEAGADALIAQGFEAGGHVWGRMSTLSLIMEVVDAVSRIPVIAAGGIGDGRGIASVLALGAAGACLGTRFIVAEESLAHAAYKARVIAASAEDTYYGEVFEIGWPNAPHRVLRNSTVNEFLKSGRNPANAIAQLANGTPVPRYSSRMPLRGMTGEVEAMALYAGPSVGHCQRIQPAADIVRELMENAAQCRVIHY